MSEDCGCFNPELKSFAELEFENAALTESNKRLLEALESIAKNTCCDKCQEASLVAKAAIREARGEI